MAAAACWSCAAQASARLFSGVPKWEFLNSFIPKGVGFRCQKIQYHGFKQVSCFYSIDNASTSSNAPKNSKEDHVENEDKPTQGVEDVDISVQNEGKKKKTSRMQVVRSTKTPLLINADHSNHETIRTAKTFLAEMKETLKESANSVEQNQIVDIELQINKMASTPANLLGLSAKELTYRFEFLKSQQFSPSLALRMALAIPTPLTWHEPTAVRMISVFRKYGVSLYKFYMDPLLLSVDASVVDANLAKLKEVGLSGEQISEAMFRNPLLAGFPLREQAVENLAFFSKSLEGEKPTFLANIVKSSMNTAGVQHERDHRYEQGVSFLNEIGASVPAVLGKCPSFFSQDADHLWACFDFLTAKPLLFDVDSLREFVEKEPDVFLLANQKPFQELTLKILEMTEDGNSVFSILTRRGRLFSSPSVVMQKIGILKKWHFKDEQIHKMFVPHTLLFLTERDNLNDRLKFLLGKGDITVNDVCKHSGLLTVRMSVMKWRIGFLREKQQLGALQEFNTSMLLSINEEVFAVQVCKATLNEFDAHVKAHAHFEKSATYLEKRTLKLGNV